MQSLTRRFERNTRIVARTELGGSIEHSRKITDLARIPDVVILADDEVIAALVPAHLEWYVRFATNRVVVAYTPRSRYADSISVDNWWRLLARTDVRVGRADPAIAPAGRQALALLERAENHHAHPTLAEDILARSPPALMRPNAAELAALLEAGEVDYILEYEGVARQYGFRFVDLPAELSLPILYGVGVPRGAVNPAGGILFVAALLSGDGMDILRGEHVSLLRVPVAIGTNIPPGITEVVRTFSTTLPAAATAAH